MPKNYFDLTSKQALITGANSGLGLGFAHALAKAGADVMIWGRNAIKQQNAVEALKQHGTRVFSRIVDVSDEKQVIDGMQDAVKQMGRLDCVIANAGTVSQYRFHELPTDEYHNLLKIAQHGGFYTLRQAAEHMVKRAKGGDKSGGSLIICGSLSIFAGGKYIAHYGAAKGALNALSKGMAVDLAEFGVRVNVVAIGLTITEMVEQNMEIAKPILEQASRHIPMGRAANVDDMDGIIMYLASDMSRYHTGDTIRLDGGDMARLNSA